MTRAPRDAVAGASTASTARLSRLVLASGNAGKLRELQALLSPLGVEAVSQRSLGIADADEPHVTFLENALAKARHASRLSGLPALADDSGICTVALEGAPGVRSARFAEDSGADDLPGAGADARNNAWLVRRLAGRERAAWYACVLVLVRHADDPHPIVADATWHGEVVDVARGAHGFGYDPHFRVPDEGLTAAELDPARKNAIGHRGRAMQALIARLRDARLV